MHRNHSNHGFLSRLVFGRTDGRVERIDTHQEQKQGFRERCNLKMRKGRWNCSSKDDGRESRIPRFETLLTSVVALGSWKRNLKLQRSQIGLRGSAWNSTTTTFSKVGLGNRNRGHVYGCLNYLEMSRTVCWHFKYLDIITQLSSKSTRHPHPNDARRKKRRYPGI